MYTPITAEISELITAACWTSKLRKTSVNGITKAHLFFVRGQYIIPSSLSNAASVSINALGTFVLNAISKRKHQLPYLCLALHFGSAAQHNIVSRQDDRFLDAITSLIVPDEFADDPEYNMECMHRVIEDTNGLPLPLCSTTYHAKLFVQMVKKLAQFALGRHDRISH